jgi:hypothetical protein
MKTQEEAQQSRSGIYRTYLQILWRSALDRGPEEPLKELSHELPAAGWNHAGAILHLQQEQTFVADIVAQSR